MQRAIKIAAPGLLSLAIFSSSALGQVEDIYKAQCLSCHGMNGRGATAAGKKMGVSDLGSQTVQDLSDEELFETIAHGVKHKKYPHAFVNRGLTSKQIADLVIYIRELGRRR